LACLDRALWLAENVMGHETSGTWGGVLFGETKKTGRPRKMEIR
jgi:hypothetical protein